MARTGWKALQPADDWCRQPGAWPIAAYSEFLPPPLIGGKPYPGDRAPIFADADPHGWPVTEAEEHIELRPGLAHFGECLVNALARLAQGQPVRGLPRKALLDNPAWPKELADAAPGLTHEHFVTLAPVALSRTQDDKGRVRWTLFGGSELGPERGFWRSFFASPKREQPSELGEAFVRRLLLEVYGVPEAESADLGRAGFRVLPHDEPLPTWAECYLLGKSLKSVRYLLTFTPFAELPKAVRAAYLGGRLHLWPCPGSLVFWHQPLFARLATELPFAQQIALLQLVERHEGPDRLRIPQCGVLHEPRNDSPHPTDPALPVKSTFKRTSRNHRVHRHADEVACSDHEDKLVHVLFSTSGDDLGLYGKPMARNVQLWDRTGKLLIDGPNCRWEDIDEAGRLVAEGGLFGYRFQYPAMRVGQHEVFWHRPLVAFRPPTDAGVRLMADAPLGVLTAYRTPVKSLDRYVELWPKLLHREPYLDSLGLFQYPRDPRPNVTSFNARKLLHAHDLRGNAPLPREFARHLLSHHGPAKLDDWLAGLSARAADPMRGHNLANELEAIIEPATAAVPESLTYAKTATRSFEVRYWKLIAQMAEGRYVNKSNADCVLDAATQAALAHHRRDLEALGEFILDHYDREVERAGMTGKALVGELPFTWETGFDYRWMGGWLNNQEGTAYERNLICVISGKDRSRAVIMSDHYDTAYMHDRYEKAEGGTGARLSAAGADDNYSATATLMLAAPIFLELSQQGKLGCDVWLIHLTGEEFPSDCLGARDLSRRVVEGTLSLRLRNGKTRSLAKTRVKGLYVLDMVAHNNDVERDEFQIAPGDGRQSLWLAEQAHLATQAWNAGTERWNRKASRKSLGRALRSAEGKNVPAPAKHLALRGEVRPSDDPRSTLYNTDGQMFSDAGIPVVLFMENYDINRVGYHDTHDTMENIDLDYGSAVAAIAIESVARAATTPP